MRDAEQPDGYLEIGRCRWKSDSDHGARASPDQGALQEYNAAARPPSTVRHGVSAARTGKDGSACVNATATVRSSLRYVSSGGRQERRQRPAAQRVESDADSPRRMPRCCPDSHATIGGWSRYPMSRCREFPVEVSSVSSRPVWRRERRPKCVAHDDMADTASRRGEYDSCAWSLIVGVVLGVTQPPEPSRTGAPAAAQSFAACVLRV